MYEYLVSARRFFGDQTLGTKMLTSSLASRAY